MWEPPPKTHIARCSNDLAMCGTSIDRGILSTRCRDEKSALVGIPEIDAQNAFSGILAIFSVLGRIPQDADTCRLKTYSYVTDSIYL